MQSIPLSLHAQSSLQKLEERNRLQFTNKEWVQYSGSFGNIYFQQGSDSLCRFVVQNFNSINKALDLKSGLKLKQRVNIILYPSTKNFYETNIGINQNPSNFSYPTLTLEKKPRLVIAFNGSYEQLTVDLKKAILFQAWNSEIENRVQNINFNQNPELKWFQLGFIAYQTFGFTAQDNENLFQLLLKCPDYKTFTSAVATTYSENQLLSSKGFSWFIYCYYGSAALKQLVAQLKQKKDIKAALRLITKKEWERNLILYYSFLQHIFHLDKSYTSIGDLKPNFDKRVDSIGWINTSDTITCFQTKIEDKKKSIIFRNNNTQSVLQSFRAPEWIDKKIDYYPLTAILNDNLCIINPTKGKLKAFIYNKSGKLLRKFYLPEAIKGINNFVVINENLWLLSAHNGNRSDIIAFNPKTFKINPITNDLADNIDLRVMDKRFIEYWSGFPLASLKTDENFSAKKYGYYSKQIDRPGNEILVTTNKHNPNEININDSLNSELTAILDHQLFWIQENEKAIKFEDSLNNTLNLSKVDTNYNSFLQGMLGSQRNEKIQLANNNVFNPKLIQSYKLNLNKLWASPSLNNDIFISRLQPYQTQFGIYKAPEIGALMQGGYADIFDNYEFNIGYKIPNNNLGSNFFFGYKNRKQLVDWSVLYFRKVDNFQPDPKANWKDKNGKPYPALAKIKTNFFQVTAKRPFNYFTSIEYGTAFRADKTVFLSTDRYGLTYNNLNSLSNINTIKFSFSNLQISSLNKNMLSGTKLQTLLDGIFMIDKTSKFTFGLGQQIVNHYQINKFINWKNQAFIGYSGGGSYIRYTLGGQDNAIINRVDSSSIPAQFSPYIFQQLINPLRGFEQNTIMGNLYFLYSTELYFQVFDKGLFNSKTRFNFLNLIQIGVFADFAFAKETFQTRHLGQYRNSLGFSTKTILANYPIRVDLAFPYSLNNKPMVHFSLSF